MKFSTILCACSLLCLPFVGQAQNVEDLTIEEKMEITYRAEQMIQELNNLYNMLTLSDIYESQFKYIVETAYENPESRLFIDEGAIIEDDLDPDKLDYSNPSDVEVSSYLKQMFLNYEKSDAPSISFENFRVSKIYQGEYAYTMVSFESTFKGRNKRVDKPYPTTKRIAQIRFEKESGKLKTYISSIYFQKPDIQFEEANYDEEFKQGFRVSETSENITVQDSLDNIRIQNQMLEDIKESFLRRNREEQQRKQNTSLLLITEGDKYYDSREFQTALTTYQRALQLTPYEVEPFLKINKANAALKELEIELQQEEKRFQRFTKNGAYSFRIRDYNAATSYYKRAQELRPGTDSIAERLRQIGKVVNEKERVEAKSRTGDCEGAIRDIGKAIKIDPNNADFYISRADCYEKTAKNKKAIDDYSSAIRLYDDYLIAYLRRGNLYQISGELAQAELDFKSAANLKPDSTELHLRLSMIRQQLNDITGAIESYNTAIRQRPTEGQYFYDRGKLYLLSQKKEDAFADFTNALTLSPNLAGAWFERGKLNLEEKQDIQAAADDFQSAKAEGLGDLYWQQVITFARNFYNKGQQLYAQKDYTGAIEEFGHAVAINPSYAEAWYSRGLAKEDNQMFIDAMNDFGEAIKLNSSYSDAYFHRGTIRYSLQDYASAASDFGDATKYRPNFIDAHISLGRALNNLEDWDLAIKSYREALKYNNKNANAYYELGLLFMKKKEYLRAQTEFSLAIKYNREFAQAYYNRGLAQSNQKIYKKAIKDFTKAILNQRTYPDAYYARGLSQMAIKKASLALPDFTRAIDQGVRPLYEAFQNKGFAYFDMGQYTQAVEAMERAIKQKGNGSRDLYLKLGESYTYLRNWEQAKANYDHIFEQSPQSPQAHYGLAQSYAAQGLYSDALSHLETALKSKRYNGLQAKKNPFLKLMKKDPAFKVLIARYP